MVAPAEQINITPQKESNVLRRWLDRLKGVGLGEARDDLLVAGGAVYGIGYVVWALHASRYNLGLLPAIESQYFIAGLAPALVILIAYKTTVLLERGLDAVRRRLGAPETGIEKFLGNLLTYCFWGSLMLGIAGSLLSRLSARLSDTISLIAIWVFTVTFFFLPDSGGGAEPPPKKLSPDYLSYLFFRGYRLLMVRYLGVAIAIVGIVFYSEKVHSVLPQEMGGGRPRCASLDLTKSALSDQTLRALFSGDVSGPESQAARSVDVDVFFAGSDYLLVKPRGRSADDRTTYEIRREAVHAVTWCR